MTLVAAATAALVAAAAPEPILLEALAPTSGENAAALLDGKPDTGWSPSGDPRGEGVLFRFEKNTPIDAIEIQACAGSDFINFVPAFNGKMDESFSVKAGYPHRQSIPKGAGALRSFFLRVRSYDGPSVCLSEVIFKRNGQPLAVRPPRTVPGKVSASSVLTPQDAYHPAYLFDGRLDFGWVEGVDGPGAGQSVTVTFDQPVTINAIELWNGYQRSKDHFTKNARAKRISLAAGNGPAVTLDVADRMGEQKLALPAPITGTSLTLKILDAIKGTVYQDLVLSELRFWDATGPFTVTTPDLAQRQAALRKSLSGTALGEITDRLFTAPCTAGNVLLRDLKLRTSNTFVWYEEMSKTEDDLTIEVFDGVWVPRSTTSPWSEVELFGRRHRVESTWRPYEEEAQVTTDRISGGKVELARVADLGPDAFWKLMKEWRAKGARDRVDCLFEGKPEAQFAQLTARGAVVVRGTALTDVLTTQAHR